MNRNLEQTKKAPNGQAVAAVAYENEAVKQQDLAKIKQNDQFNRKVKVGISGKIDNNQGCDEEVKQHPQNPDSHRDQKHNKAVANKQCLLSERTSQQLQGQDMDSGSCQSPHNEVQNLLNVAQSERDQQLDQIRESDQEEVKSPRQQDPPESDDDELEPLPINQLLNNGPIEVPEEMRAKKIGDKIREFGGDFDQRKPPGFKVRGHIGQESLKDNFANESTVVDDNGITHLNQKTCYNVLDKPVQQTNPLRNGQKPAKWIFTD